MPRCFTAWWSSKKIPQDSAVTQGQHKEIGTITVAALSKRRTYFFSKRIIF
jgi:hypothetical protein